MYERPPTNGHFNGLFVWRRWGARWTAQRNDFAVGG